MTIEKNDLLNSKLENLPDKPGVYQFINELGKVIYVGKAKNLRNRVRSYFHGSAPSGRIQIMVKKIHDLSLIVTDSEIEALVLENNLIKELKPRYNVLLKDDKTFPFIKVTNEPYPRIYPTRRLVRDGSRYFGPYTDVKTMKIALRTVNQIFRIRSCKLNLNEENIAKKKFKVCLDYHIKKCDGPCEGLIGEEAYKSMVNEVVKYLSGKTAELINDLTRKMNLAAENLEFENAAQLRDKISKLGSIVEKQKIVNDDFEDRDIIAVAYEGKDASCSIFVVRNGKLIGKKQFRVAIEGEIKSNEIYSSVIKLYYNEYVDIPKQIIIEEEPDDWEVIQEWLGGRAGYKVELHIPQRGNLRSFLKLCKENAILQLKDIQIQKMKKEGNIPFTLAALKRDLRLSKIPRRIECFDISNLQGSDTVASMVVFVDGKPKKSEYRKFIIREVNGPNDFLSMHEVVTRRYDRLLKESKPLPDLIMIDGGKGQLSSAVSALNSLGAKGYEIMGLAKRLEEIFLPGESDPVIIPKTSSALKLLQQVRDEAHRFAVTFHRERRSKRTITTELLEIKGIGPKLGEKLLKNFGSLKNLRQADFTAIAEVIGEKKANILIRHFNQGYESVPGGNIGETKI